MKQNSKIKIKTWIQSKIVTIIDILDKKGKFYFSVNSAVFVNSVVYVNSAVYVNSNPDTKSFKFDKKFKPIFRYNDIEENNII